jgi:hypothetical protein
MNIFELASRGEFRYTSAKGLLTTEDLWQLPLRSRTGCDLDAVAKAVNAKLKSTTEESFVEVKSNPQKATFEAQLEIVKHIIAVKIGEHAAAAQRLEKRDQVQKLESILARKQDAGLEALSEEEIAAQLAALKS